LLHQASRQWGALGGVRPRVIKSRQFKDLRERHQLSVAPPLRRRGAVLAATRTEPLARQLIGISAPHSACERRDLYCVGPAASRHASRRVACMAHLVHRGAVLIIHGVSR
jgi:hypothetical protein